MVSPTSAVRCRQIEPNDLDGVRRLLIAGFPARSPAAWARAMARLEAYRGPPGLPRYGYLLEADGRPVGVLLMIASSRCGGSGERLSCNLSSWYVEAAYRAYAPQLAMVSTRRREVTYVNLSPAPYTRQTIEALGFTSYNPGTFLCAPLLSANRVAATLLPADAPASALPGAGEHDRDLVAAHARLGCVAFWCLGEGRSHPFVFVARPPIKRFVPCAQLVYCHDTADVARFAQTIGRRLLASGFAALAIDAAGPMQGLLGRYVAGQSPHYFKGPDRPRLGDLAFSEAVLFGMDDPPPKRPRPK